jgi:hypothetical protein
MRIGERSGVALVTSQGRAVGEAGFTTTSDGSAAAPYRCISFCCSLLQLNLTIGHTAMQEVALTTSESDSADREVLLELNRNYVRSALESDVRWYSENLSEDFYITAPDGALLNREAFLERIANPYPGTEAEAVDVTIRILGDFAIIHSGYRDKKLTGDTGYGRYTDIYQRRNGRWLCVAAHFMRFQTPPKT